MKNPFKFSMMKRSRLCPGLDVIDDVSSRFRKDDGGATAIEFVFVFPAFIALVFLVMQSALTYWTHHTLDFGVHETVRLVRTGQVTSQSLSKHKFKETICEFVSMTKSDCISKIAIELRPMPGSLDYSPPMKDGKLNDQNASYDSGANGTLMMLKAFLPADQLNTFNDILGILPGVGSTPREDLVLRSVALFRNEP